MEKQVFTMNENKNWENNGKWSERLLTQKRYLIFLY